MSSCKLNLKVIPGASRSEIVGWLGDSLKIKVAARPEKGKANKEVEALLHKVLNLPNGCIQIVSGKTSKVKIVTIEGLTQAEVQQLVPN